MIPLQGGLFVEFVHADWADHCEVGFVAGGSTYASFRSCASEVGRAVVALFAGGRHFGASYVGMGVFPRAVDALWELQDGLYDGHSIDLAAWRGHSIDAATQGRVFGDRWLGMSPF